MPDSSLQEPAGYCLPDQAGLYSAKMFTESFRLGGMQTGHIKGIAW